MYSKRRLPAEWEPQSCIQFTFPHRDSDWADTYEAALDCFVNCITIVSQFEQVSVVCNNAIETQSYLNHIPASDIQFVEIPSNDTWARDHGGISIWENEKAVILDFQFNAWGLKFAADQDNLITQRLHQKGIFQHTELRTLGFVLEGGSIESDGQGTLFTTTNCLLSPNRNPHLDQHEIEQYLIDIFGLKRVLWLDHGYLEGDDTDAHIDTLARFCSPDTIAYVQCNDPKDIHYEALKKMEAQLRTFRTLEGKPYQLIPLPLPDAIFDDEGNRLPATYANFLFVNGGIIVPTYDCAQDNEVLGLFRQIFPERKVVGVDCRRLIIQHGSLHCITMQYPRKDV